MHTVVVHARDAELHGRVRRDEDRLRVVRAVRPGGRRRHRRVLRSVLADAHDRREEAQRLVHDAAGGLVGSRCVLENGTVRHAVSEAVHLLVALVTIAVS